MTDINNTERLKLFDNWAAAYDPANDRAGFPFAGYEHVLDSVFAISKVAQGMTVVDLGTGTGNLLQRFAKSGCALWGLDFSLEMLEKARASLPSATLLQADLLSAPPAELPQNIDLLISAYVFHEFSLEQKLTILERYRPYLHTNASIIIADIAYEDAHTFANADQSRWDPEEHYWQADVALEALLARGFTGMYRQISACAGIFMLTINPHQPAANATL